MLRKNLISKITITLLTQVALWCVSFAYAQESQLLNNEYTLEQRLGRLVDLLEQKRRELHVPGMALAVIKDDAVIFTKGFGWANIEKQIPATPETIFAIGSATKAFGTSLIGMLVDEGKMDWDDPVAKHLPYFQLKTRSQEPGDEATLRDLLCHRTGLMRMNLLLLNGERTREEALRLAIQAESMVGLRKSFNYTNIMHMAAGEAAARAGGQDWDTLVQKRIFEPLGMNNTVTSTDSAWKHPQIATGYIWEEYLWENKPLSLRDLDMMGPAGSIHSNALDMANWVRFQLRRGEFMGKRLLSEASHQETWTPQFIFGENNAYGLGWFIQEWEGQPLIQHGGGVDGFSAQVALLPESQLGYVLLTNSQSSPIRLDSMNLVWEAILGDKPSLPTVEEILRLRNSKRSKDTVNKLGVFRLTGSVKRLQSGVSGKVTWTASSTDHLNLDQDFGEFGHIRLALDPNRAATISTIFIFQELRGRFFEQTRTRHPAAVFGDWRDFYETMEVTEAKKQGERQVYVLKLTAKDVPTYTATVDAETGDLLRLDTRRLRPGSEAQMMEIYLFEDYREIHGLRIPFRINSVNPYQGRTTMEFEKLETQISAQDNIFTLTPPKKESY